jgi:hypothetical protein
MPAFGRKAKHTEDAIIEGSEQSSEESTASEGESESGSGTNTTSCEADGDDAHQEIQKLSEKETQRMQFFRFSLIILILFTGFIVAAGTFVYLTSEEHNSYVTGVSAQPQH